MHGIILLILTIASSGLLLYWLLITTEGVFLGQRIVVWLYDLTAHRYDGIKQFDPNYEYHFLTKPFLRLLADLPHPAVLDVATGTGRMPYNLLTTERFGGARFTGQITALDASKKMLEVAAARLTPLSPHVQLIHHPAVPLPFPDESFDAVTCLEALEFLSDDAAALREMVRVLRPGGLLLTTRRVGWEGKAFLHRYRSRENLEDLLRDLGLIHIRTEIWQVGYNKVTAVKPENQEIATDYTDFYS